MRLSGMKSNC